MKRQLRGLMLATLAATALGAGAGWAWSSLTPGPAPTQLITTPEQGPGCRSGQCCTLSIAAESLLSGSQQPAKASADCCDADAARP